MATEHKFYADNLVSALLEEGIPAEQIWELDGWKTNQQGYYWTDVQTDAHHGYNGVANGHLNHHTASKGYTPYVVSNGKTKANVWLGSRVGGRLYESATSGVPTLALASAGPANYSSGSGVRTYVKALKAGEKLGRQTLSDDDPKFYGNRYLWNTEIVCDGVGGKVDQDVWDLIIVYNAALARLHDSTAYWNGFHAGFTRRKIDYRDGRYLTAQQTMEGLWVPISAKLGGGVIEPPIEPPVEPPVEPPPTPQPPPEEPMDDQGRNQLYVKEGMSGQDVEYWQVMSIMAHDNIPFSGNSNRTFIQTHAPELTWKEWNTAMTAYLSSWTGRNSYGIGATERVMISTAVMKIYAALA